jgi:sulfur-oxidizing protein SoxA
MKAALCCALGLWVAGGALADERRSGLLDMSPALQALQRDDAQNPGLLWLQDGAALWAATAGGSAKSCAQCHGDVATSQRGVAARYPAWDTAAGRALTLADRINTCRSRHQQAAPWPAESTELLSLTLLVGFASRGLPVAPAAGATMLALRQQGQALWQQRLGQLNLACQHCHDQRAGQRLGGAVIPQGHATGYPAYRLEWQGLGSLQRRLRACVVGVRAQPWAPDAPEWVALEAWLAQRAAGMVVETPAVRP